MDSVFCLIFLSLILSPSTSSSSPSSTLRKGSSLSVERPDQFLISSNSVFIAGFYPIGDNAYCFAIWFNESSSPKKTIVWMANRDDPVNGRRSKLSLLKNGNLILTDVDRVVWETNTILHNSSWLQLQDTGNVILTTADGVIWWQSFHSPTDTLLPLQPLTRETELVSSRSQTNFSSGFYKLSFHDDNVLSILYYGPQVSSVFWPHHSFLPRQVGRTTYNSTRIAILDSLGQFTSSDNLTFSSTDYGVNIQRRLTLDFDGNLRLYSREDGSKSWVVSWQALSETCRIHAACGPNSVCRYDPAIGRECSCLPGFERIKNTDWSFGCQPKFNLSCAKTEEATFLRLPYVESNGYDFAYWINCTLDRCKELCLQRCDCKGFVFKFVYNNNPDNIPYCFPKTQLLNGYYTENFRGDMYLKVPNTMSFQTKWLDDNSLSLNCSAQVVKLDRKYGESRDKLSVKFLFWFVIGFGVLESFIIIVWILLIRNWRNKDSYEQGHLLSANGFRRFSYSELRKTTRNFREEIGRGAGGIVYKGILNDNRVAAIKRLNIAEQGEAEFLAELSTIGKLNHMNVIEMWGYCAEGKHRLLVYEYMENGSLAKNLSSKVLDWQKKFEITVGTAKGLAYLHEECLEWIVHCDIKPENILLDSDYQPKVSDFGLSRLLSRSENRNETFTRMRGTRGYMAPEWVLNTEISAKVDVYSYGIVVLEIMTGKTQEIATHYADSKTGEEQERLVEWVRKKKSAGGAANISWVKEIIDPEMGIDYDAKKLGNVIEVALQCVEENKEARPTMRQVVEMLLQYEQDPIMGGEIFDPSLFPSCRWIDFIS